MIHDPRPLCLCLLYDRNGSFQNLRLLPSILRFVFVYNVTESGSRLFINFSIPIREIHCTYIQPIMYKQSFCWLLRGGSTHNLHLINKWSFSLPEGLGRNRLLKTEVLHPDDDEEVAQTQSLFLFSHSLSLPFTFSPCTVDSDESYTRPQE